MKRTLTLVSLAIIVGLSAFVIASQIESGVAIYKGWNLIYGLSEPSQLEAGSFDPSHIKAIYAFIPQTQTYFRTWPSPSFEDVEALKKIISEDELIQTAFWVYSDFETGKTFNGIYNGVEYGLQDAPVSYTKRPLYKGWNFVGATPDMTGKSLEDIKGTCDITRLLLWDPTALNGQGNWDDETDKVANPLPSGMFGRGLVVKVTNNCNLGATSNVPSVPQLPNGESTPSTSSFEFPQTISGYTLFKTTDENTICVTEFYNLCLDPIKAEYRNSATGKVVFVQGNKITSGTNNDLKSIFANQVGGTLSTFMIGSNKVYKVENHEIFWFNADKSYVFIQEGAFTTSSTGTNFNYGNVDPNNEVIKYFLSKYPSINVD